MTRDAGWLDHLLYSPEERAQHRRLAEVRDKLASENDKTRAELEIAQLQIKRLSAVIEVLIDKLETHGIVTSQQVDTEVAAMFAPKGAPVPGGVVCMRCNTIVPPVSSNVTADGIVCDRCINA